MRLRNILFILCALSCLTPWISAPVALVGGFLFVLFLGNPYPAHSKKISGTLLKISVVGLGFGMDIHSAIRAGKDGFWLTVASICFVLLLGSFAGKRLGMPRRVAHLVSSGTAICGGSAIAAVGPAVRATAQEMSVALGVVFLLNAVALVLFPLIGHTIGLDQYHFGMWCAIAIHDTSSVVGAASAYGAEALQVATTVKLARALWILPLTMVSAFLFKSGEGKPRVPLFIFGFILAICINTWMPMPEGIAPLIVKASRAALVLCLFLIGTALSPAAVREVGWKPMALGVILWLAVSVLSLPAVMYLL